MILMIRQTFRNFRIKFGLPWISPVCLRILSQHCGDLRWPRACRPTCPHTHLCSVLLSVLLSRRLFLKLRPKARRGWCRNHSWQGIFTEDLHVYSLQNGKLRTLENLIIMNVKFNELRSINIYILVNQIEKTLYKFQGITCQVPFQTSHYANLSMERTSCQGLLVRLKGEKRTHTSVQLV